MAQTDPGAKPSGMGAWERTAASVWKGRKAEGVRALVKLQLVLSPLLSAGLCPRVVLAHTPPHSDLCLSFCLSPSPLLYLGPLALRNSPPTPSLSKHYLHPTAASDMAPHEEKTNESAEEHVPMLEVHQEKDQDDLLPSPVSAVQARPASSNKPKMSAAMIIPIWIVLSSAVIIYNNYLYNTLQFRYPVFLVTWHLTFAVSIILFLTWISLGRANGPALSLWRTTGGNARHRNRSSGDISRFPQLLLLLPLASQVLCDGCPGKRVLRVGDIPWTVGHDLRALRIVKSCIVHSIWAGWVASVHRCSHRLAVDLRKKP